jgi:hypothetical protein
LPTDQETGLPFHVNGDFLLTASRDALLMDKKWNQLLFNHLVNLVAFAGTYLPCISEASFVEALQLVPNDGANTPTFFQQLSDKILLRLRPLSLVPVLDSEARARASDCNIVPADLLKLKHRQFPTRILIVDMDIAIDFTAQMAKLGVKNASKDILESIIESQLPSNNEKPNPKWFCQLYVFMASSLHWMQPSTRVVTRLQIILLQDGTLANFGATVYQPFCAANVTPFLEWCKTVPIIDKSALPTDCVLQNKVCRWLAECQVKSLDLTAAVHFVLMELQSCTATEVLKVTNLLMDNNITAHQLRGALPLVCKNNQVVCPPFHLPVAEDSKLLELFGNEECKFHLMSAAYFTNPLLSTYVKTIFSSTPYPPLPSVFSWMTCTPLHVTVLQAEMLLELLANTTVRIPHEIQKFLNEKPWLPTTQGSIVPHHAYLPTPELCELFGDSVPYVVGKIANNGMCFCIP